MVDPVSLTIACVAGATVVGAVIIETCRRRSAEIKREEDTRSADTGDFTTEGFSLIIKKTGPNGEVDEFNMTAAKFSAKFQEHDTNTHGISAQSIATGHDVNPLAGAGQQQARGGIPALPAPAGQANGDQNAPHLPGPDVALQIPATAADLFILQTANPNASQFQIGELSSEAPDGTNLVIKNSSFVIVPQASDSHNADAIRRPGETEWVGTGSTFLGKGFLGMFKMVADTLFRMQPSPDAPTPLQSVRIDVAPLHHNAADPSIPTPLQSVRIDVAPLRTEEDPVGAGYYNARETDRLLSLNADEVDLSGGNASNE